MVRRNRNWHPNGFYHVIMRGNNRQNIFNGEGDVKEYFRILNYVYFKYPFELYAYCIMTNHVHFLLKSPIVPLGKLMTPINRRYSDYYRKKHNYTGQIYENRYYSKEVIDPNSLLNVSAYIHRNPIETKTPMVEVMEHYPYSSYHNYFYNTQSPHPFINLELLPSFLPIGSDKTKKAYAAYCVEYEERTPEEKEM